VSAELNEADGEEESPEVIAEIDQTEPKAGDALQRSAVGARGSADRPPEPLGDVQTGVLREAVSKAGRLVRMTCDSGEYAIVYLHEDGRRPQVARYTPFAARAEWLFEQLCRDVVDPQALADRKGGIKS
jgi:hypothetical protein